LIKSISVLGSTGSIGTQTLDVAKKLNISVKGISANQDIDTLEQQIYEFNPELCVVKNQEKALELAKRLQGKKIKCEIESGLEGLKMLAAMEGTDTCVVAIVGIAGLIPTLEAINSGKNIALANKETLVTAGGIVMEAARKNNVNIFPIDSEHSAIFQCLQGNRKEDVSRIILTASGGPFFGKTRDDLENVTVEQALNHPTWKMGNKITIDSATLMNKGLEVIEAHWLFDLDADRIDVVVHPQSVIHSMVEYVDGSIMAQLGTPDMRIPIALSLTFPERHQFNFSKLDLLKVSNLSFYQPDMNTFKCLRLAYDALEAGGTMPAVLNGANEACVNLFIRGIIGFNQIGDLVEEVMQKHKVMPLDLDNIINADMWSREYIGGINKL
jgi:1-deoxy-D-xylulose-5-phosphate reductoisomerase